MQALAHSSGYDSTDEEEAGLEAHTRGQTGLRGARSEEFLDRRSPERRPGPSHRSVEDIYWGRKYIDKWSALTSVWAKWPIVSPLENERVTMRVEIG